MIFTLKDIIAGRPIVGYGVGEYLDRAMCHTTLKFSYFVSEVGAGSSRYGAPVFDLQRLTEEKRDIVVFIFDKYNPRIVRKLAQFGLQWQRNIFDCRYFGVNCNYYDEYEILESMVQVQASPSIIIHAGLDSELQFSGITVPKRKFFLPINIYVGNGARVVLEDVVLESGVSIYAGSHATVQIGPGTMVLWDTKLSAAVSATLSIGRQALIGYNSIIDAANKASIRVGDFSTFGKRLELFAYAPIFIGRDCMFSSNVYVESGAGHDLVCGGEKSYPEPVAIGDHVWVGMSSTVLAGGSLGAGTMVAANSLVNKPFSSELLVAGVPARVLRDGVTWCRDYTAYKEFYGVDIV